MIKCSGCGKSIDKIPSWLVSARVDFVCNNCPNRTAKSIALVTLEPEPKAPARVDDDEEIDVEEIADEDAAP